MTKYRINYKGKNYVSYGEDCEEAMKRFAGRKVFGGNPLIFSYRLVLYDADTRGHRWVEYLAGIDHNLRVMVTRE